MSNQFDNQTEKKDLSIFDEAYNVQEFKKDLFYGKLRWFSTILTLANIGLLLFMALDSEEPELNFLVTVRGNAVWWILSFTLIIWASLALINWMFWLKRRAKR